jgi:hypothetical protein
VYEYLTKEDSGPGYKRVWKEKMPEKIKKNYVAHGTKVKSYQRQHAEKKLAMRPLLLFL